MTVSLWQQHTDGGITHCDCLIIGGGVCGISAALHAERRGLDVAVVERGRLGAGASSRNAGFLMRGAAENYAAAIREYGRDTARLIWRWSEENLAGLREEGIETTPFYHNRASCLLALEEREHAELRESLVLMREDGFAVEWLDGGDDDAWRNLRPLGGLINPSDAVCHPLHVLRHLAALLRGEVQENCEVVGIAPKSEPGDGRIMVHTSRGEYRAMHVVVCTNAYGPLLLEGLRGIITPRRGQMIAVRSPKAHLVHSYYANFGYEYFRRVDEQVVIFGGCRREYADAEIGYEDRTTPEVQQALKHFAARVLGTKAADLDIVARWSGTMGFSPDGLPLVGPVPGPWAPERVYFCGGFTGHGMSLAHRTARSAIDCMLDGVESPLPLSRVNLSRAAGRLDPAD